MIYGSKKDLISLKKSYKKAVDNKEDQFVWQNQTLLTAYAKYLIEYAEQEMKRMGI
jgi:hypothetical protein